MPAGLFYKERVRTELWECLYSIYLIIAIKISHCTVQYYIASAWGDSLDGWWPVVNPEPGPGDGRATFSFLNLVDIAFCES